MSKLFEESLTRQCEQTGKKVCLTIRYSKVSFLGSSCENEVIHNFKCSNSNCNFADSDQCKICQEICGF